MLDMICDKLSKVEAIQPLKINKDYTKFLMALEEEVSSDEDKLKLGMGYLLFEEGK